jgi:hypothetical protein
MVTSAVGKFGAEAHQTLGVARVLVAGAVTATVVFAVCWLGAFLPFASPTHAYVSLFTTADIRSGWALVEGSFWSLLFGGLTAALFALVYNAAAAIGRR